MYYICYNFSEVKHMIKNNLAVLMAERNIKASKISAETGISRSTLNSISNNSSKMIQLETINSLCQYLNITPNDFFDFIPFDVSFQSEISEEPKTSFEVRDPEFYINSFEISGLTFDGYLKQSYIRDITGKRERTFDITVKQVNRVTANDFSDDQDNVNINFEVLLGHITDSETFSKQEAEFNSLWNDSINTNFQTSIKKEIINSITKNFLDILKFASGDSKEYENASFAINKLRLFFDFSFNNAYNEIEKNEPIINIDIGDILYF